mmetsp:Transcript_101160/g.326508  ORF Transcript_101160/g.326508 Transcript_101160/m.326508 type:complete len:412 (+) Transcript_101160:149-1384(+)
MAAEPKRRVVNNIKAALDQSASWAASLARSATDTIRKEYKFTFDDLSCNLLTVRPNLLVVEFPRRNTLHWLATRLNRDHGGSYLLVNLSGQTYDTNELQGPVMDIMMSGCVPPIDVLLRLCVSAHKWLSASPQNVLAAHGADSKESGVGALGPVVVLFASYLSWAGLVPYPMEGLLEVCSALNIPDAAVWPSQRRYLGYFELLQRGCLQTAGTPVMRLARLELVQVVGDGAFRLLEVWQQERLLFQADLNPDSASVAKGAGGTTVLDVGAPCRGDIVVRVLRAAALASEESLPVLELQVCFHTAFVAAVGNFARFPARELDSPFRSAGATLSPGCAIDVFLEPACPEEEELGDPQEASSGAAAASAAKGTEYYSLAAADAEAASPEASTSAPARSSMVFVPEDIDDFFSEL